MPSKIAVKNLSTYEPPKNKSDICVVIGNGRSLLDVPREFLAAYDTIGTNRIYLLDGFTPTYYVAINPLVVEQSADEINGIKCEAKYITAAASGLIDDAVPIKSVYVPHFSTDPFGTGVYEGYTVTYVALQIAYALGYRIALLVGVDHDYQFIGAPNEERVADGDDPNHFSPRYFGDGARWNNPDLVQSERAYRMARRAYEMAGGRVINLTPRTKETVFEKGAIAEWLPR